MGCLCIRVFGGRKSSGGAVLEKEQRADTLIYPVAFLYRHYLELRLKEIIVQGAELLAQQSDLKPVHKLDVLWNSVRSILETVWPNGPRTDLDAVENVIGQFHKLDLTSMAFRYPVDLKNNATLSGLAHVGPRNLMKVCSEPPAYSKPRARQSPCI